MNNTTPEKTEKFEKIEKVTLDLTHYPGEDLYSDGDVEEKLLGIAKSGEDLEEVIMSDNDWAVLYHFSEIRHNLLSWYDFNPEGTLLEIGSGCGAMSGLFAKKVKSVTAIELSKRRSTINAYRNRNCDNLTIKLGNFQDIDLKGEKFDYVTLIGVFEYSILYIDSKEPFEDMLRRCKSFLKPGGVLIIAIENKYGLKYFAGATEDHNGVAFEGIEDYPTAKNVRTFTRHGLKNILAEAGFDTEFYYPYPDYKMPTVIHSDKYLPGPNELRDYSPAYDRERKMLFNERRAYAGIIRDGYYPDFANSFLVFCK